MGSSLNKAGSSLHAESLSCAAPALAYGLFGALPATILLFCLFPSRHSPAPGPTFAQLKPRLPALGLFPSAVLHGTLAVACLYSPLINLLTPPRIVEVRWNDLKAPQHERMVMTSLYYYSPSTALAHHPALALKSSQPGSPRQQSHIPAQSADPSVPQATYSGPQEVVSLSASPTNSIQTIIRPDLVDPPSLKSPQLLKPVVLLSSGAPASSQPRPAELAAPIASDQPAGKSSLDPAANIAHALSPATSQIPRRPQLEVESDAPSNSTISAIVINAVMVPENAPIALPQAELSGSFAVRTVHSAQPNADADDSGTPGAPSNTASAADKLAQAKVADAPSVLPIRKVADGALASRTGSSGNNAASQSPNHPTQAAMASPVPRATVLGESARASGITIIGGTGREGSRVAAMPTHSPRYGLTVISSGTSGGASRDLGVFDRSEIVYTIYVPMGDVGGGPDWSIQYALWGASQVGGDLLVPPLPVKKARAVVAEQMADCRPTTIFFSGVVSATGEMTINVPLRMDERGRQALDALLHWKFLPAQLNGVAVAIRILVGVASVCL